MIDLKASQIVCQRQTSEAAINLPAYNSLLAKLEKFDGLKSLSIALLVAAMYPSLLGLC